MMSETQNQLIKYLQELSSDEREATLHRCCGSVRWAKALSEALLAEQLHDHESLFKLSEQIWHSLDKVDYLEAFSHHPQIGADPAKLRERFQHTHEWSAHEQSGMQSASEDTIMRLAQANQEYLAKFGYIFIVCASGKSADEMLKLLEQRLPNTAENEIQIAAGEQAKITRLRMEKLL